MANFEGLSSLSGFLLLLLFFSACRSTRQYSELIHIAQRQQHQVQRYDTLWQALNLKMDDLVVEWETDTTHKQVKTVRLMASKAEAELQHQALTLTKASTCSHDTLAVEQTETTSHSATVFEKKRRSLWWLVLLVVAAVGLGIVLMAKRMKWH